MSGKIIMLGIGEMAVTRNSGESIKTMSLGSCVAIILLDPINHAIGMVHVALPDSSIDGVKALAAPGYFADTAVPALLTRMSHLGCQIHGPKFMVKLAGGSNILDPSGVFNIGKRNILTIKKILWQLKMAALAEDIGGDISRTVEVYQDTGDVLLSSPVRGQWRL